MKHETRLALAGAWKVTRYDRATGRLLGETPWAPNTITGKSLFLDLARGASSAHFDATSQLRVESSTINKTISGTKSGAAPTHTYFDGGSASVSWTFRDDSADTYTPTTIRLWNSLGSEFSNVTVSFGTKPTSEIWDYTYTLTFADTASPVQLQGAGLDRFLRCMTNENATSSQHYSSVYMEVYTGSPTYAENYPAIRPSGLSAWAQGSGVVQATTANSITYRLTVNAPPTSTSWGTVLVFWPIRSGTASDVCLCRRAGPGSQPPTENWTYDWTISI